MRNLSVQDLLLVIPDSKLDFLVEETKITLLSFEDDYLQLQNDQLVDLFDSKGKKLSTPFRLIQGILKRKSGNQKIVLLTNIMDLSTTEVAEIHKERWAIERFFRMINRTADAAKS